MTHRKTIVLGALLAVLIGGCRNETAVDPAARRGTAPDESPAHADEREALAEPPASAGEGEAPQAPPHNNPLSGSFALPSVGLLAPQPISFTADITPPTAATGDEVMFAVTATISPTWHIYALSSLGGMGAPTALQLDLPDGLTPVGDWEAPTPEVLPTEFGATRIYYGEVVFSRRLRVTGKFAPGATNIPCKISYQACDNSRCLQPAEITVSAPLETISSQEPKP